MTRSRSAATDAPKASPAVGVGLCNSTATAPELASKTTTLPGCERSAPPGAPTTTHGPRPPTARPNAAPATGWGSMRGSDTGTTSATDDAGARPTSKPATTRAGESFMFARLLRASSWLAPYDTLEGAVKDAPHRHAVQGVIIDRRRLTR